jgi:hypothetical protein
MARIDALSIELLNGGLDKLEEQYGKVIENIATGTLSSVFANKDLSGDPKSGTMEAKRFVNVAGNAYGTARTGGAAQKIKAKPVVIAIDDNKEYLEEVEEKDLTMYGVDGLIARRTANHQMMIQIDNDKAFFQEMYAAGAQHTETGSTAGEKLESAIGALETTKNDFVNGVPRQMIKVVMAPAKYGEMRNYLDTGVNNSNVNTGVGEYGQFHGVDVFSSVNLPAGVDYVVFVDGAVAQPKAPRVYEPRRVEFSDATAFGIFIYKGTKAVMPDLIKYVGTKYSV